ncbi:MAG: ATP-binding protein [Nibricoccus sp.]
MSEMLVRFTEASGSSPLLDEFPIECQQCIVHNYANPISCPIDQKQARHRQVKSGYGSIVGCSKKPTLVRGASTFDKILEAKLPILKELAFYKRQLDSRYDREYKRLLHNIESHDAHIIQEFQNVATEDEMVENRNRHREFLADQLSEDPIRSARALLKIFQSAIGIKNEITIYRRLYMEKQWQDERGVHRVHAVILNTAYKFFEDFTAAGIKLNVGQTQTEVYVDFECVSVILYHLLDNSRKYAAPGRPIDVTYAETSQRIDVRVSMVSLASDPEERESLYLPGVSGKYAKDLKRDSKGQGLAIVRDITSKTDITFSIDWDVENNSVMYNGVPYTRNVFHVGMRLARK